MKNIQETDTNPAVLYNYAKAPKVSTDGYDPTRNVDVDRSKEQEEDLLAMLKDCLDVAEPSDADTVSQDELPKDHPYVKAIKEIDPEAGEKMAKEMEHNADKIVKSAEKLESTLNSLCSGERSLEETFKTFNL